MFAQGSVLCSRAGAECCAGDRESPVAGFPGNIPQAGEEFTNVTWLSVVQ